MVILLNVERSPPESAAGVQGGLPGERQQLTQQLQAARWVVQAGIMSPVANPVVTVTPFCRFDDRQGAYR